MRTMNLTTLPADPIARESLLAESQRRRLGVCAGSPGSMCVSYQRGPRFLRSTACRQAVAVVASVQVFSCADCVPLVGSLTYGQYSITLYLGSNQDVRAGPP